MYYLKLSRCIGVLRLKENNYLKVSVLGLGHVGLPTAEYILNRGHRVYGYDINLNAVKEAKNHRINATNDWNKIPKVDVYIICVSTLLREELPNLSPIFDVSEKIAEKAIPSSLVSIESTVIPGTSRKIYKEIFGEGANLVHVPHRYWVEDPLRHGVKQHRVMGAVNSESLNLGLRFYKDLMEVPIHVVSSVEVA